VQSEKEKGERKKCRVKIKDKRKKTKDRFKVQGSRISRFFSGGTVRNFLTVESSF